MKEATGDFSSINPNKKEIMQGEGDGIGLIIHQYG
jgi:hypothetical protein